MPTPDFSFSNKDMSMDSIGDLLLQIFERISKLQTNVEDLLIRSNKVEVKIDAALEKASILEVRIVRLEDSSTRFQKDLDTHIGSADKYLQIINDRVDTNKARIETVEQTARVRMEVAEQLAREAKIRVKTILILLAPLYTVAIGVTIKVVSSLLGF